MLEQTARAANALCAQHGLAPIMDPTPHMLRRTDISLLAAAGYDPAWIWPRSATPTRRSRCASTPRSSGGAAPAEYHARANEVLGGSPAAPRPGIGPTSGASGPEVG
jgi:hypothetical protein